MERIWYDPGFGGTTEEYTWLEANYGVTVQEDNHWIDILEHYVHGVPVDEILGPDDPVYRALLTDPQKVQAFLEQLLHKYESNTAIYPE
jgi:hypothetical protein